MIQFLHTDDLQISITAPCAGSLAKQIHDARIESLKNNDCMEGGIIGRKYFADLYEKPLTSFGLNAADKLFSECDLEELVLLVKRLAD